MSRIYIAGKISGLSKEEYTAKFEQAKVDLQLLGHTGISPIDYVDETVNWELQMLDCLSILIACDAIYMLDNWTDSTGAKIEHAFAERIGIPIHTQNESSFQA